MEDQDIAVPKVDTLRLKRRNAEINFFSFAFGVNRWYHKESGLQLPSQAQELELRQARSWQVRLAAFPTRVNLGGHHFNFYTQAEFDFFNFFFVQPVILSDSTAQPEWTVIDEDFRKNKLGILSFTVPAMLGYAANKKRPYKGFRVKAGVYAGIRMASWTRRRTQDRDNSFQVGDYNLNRYRYGLEARIGYKFLEVFVQYDASPFFERADEPELHTVSLGLSLLTI